jgi:hypothetical protein
LTEIFYRYNFYVFELLILSSSAKNKDGFLVEEMCNNIEKTFIEENTLKFIKSVKI